MFNDAIESFKENIKQKTTNPFLGTLLVVWIIHNWELLYSVFNFDYNTNLQARINFISKYMSGWQFTKDLAFCAIISLGVLVATYLLLGAGRFLANLYDDVVIPWLQKITNINKVVTRENHERVIRYVDELEEKLAKEKIRRQDLETRLEEAEKKFLKVSTPPEQPASTTEQAPAEKKEKKKKNKNKEPVKILIIEDDPGLSQLMGVALKERGWEPIIAVTGVEAIEKIKAQRPTLVLLDYSLSDMSGTGFLDAAQQERISLPPFIVTTGRGDERIAVEMMKRGARDYIVKDSQFLNTLATAVDRTLEQLEVEQRLMEAEHLLRDKELETQQRLEEAERLLKENHVIIADGEKGTNDSNLLGAVLENIKKENMVSQIVSAIKDVSTGKPLLQDNPHVKYTAGMGLIRFEKILNYSNNLSVYRITEKGEKIRDLLIKEGLWH